MTLNFVISLLGLVDFFVLFLFFDWHEKDNCARVEDRILVEVLVKYLLLQLLPWLEEKIHRIHNDQWEDEERGIVSEEWSPYVMNHYFDAILETMADQITGNGKSCHRCNTIPNGPTRSRYQ